MRKRCVSLVAVVLALGALVAPAFAGAAPATVRVGSPLATLPTQTASFLGAPSLTVANTSLPDAGAAVASPVDGVVVRWRLGPQLAADQYALRILHPVGGGAYVATGTSLTRTASTSWIEVFETALPIRAGDLIGLEPKAPNPVIRGAEASGHVQSFWDPSLDDDGVAAQPKAGPEIEYPFNADVQPAPQVTLVTPTSGPPAGGTVVTIAGRNFDAISGVKFGDAAASFTVDSEGEITATAPPAALGPGEVDVTVTGFAGTSAIVARDRFTYVAPQSPGQSPGPPSSGPPSPAPPPPAGPGCKVPKLAGRTLPSARKALRRNQCRLGRVRHRGEGRTRIGNQNPKQGTVRPAGSAVNVGLR